MTKLAQGLLDLHSKRGAVDLAALAEIRQRAGGGSPSCRAPHPGGQHRRAKPLRSRKPTALRSAMRSRGRRRRPLQQVVAGSRDRGRDRAVRPRRNAGRPAPFRSELLALIFAEAGIQKRKISVMRRLRESGGDSRHRRARCRGNPPPRARARPGSARCARSRAGSDFRGDIGERAAHDALVGPAGVAPPPRPGNRRHRTA